MPANPAPPNAVVPSVLLGLSLLVSAGLAARAPRTFDALGPCVPGLFAPLQATREAVPLALAHHRGAIYALLATPDREGFSVEVFRLRGALSTRIATRRAPSLDAISGFVVGSNGPMFAVARRETVTVTTLGDTVRDAEFPRGEQPEGRPALTPTVALAAEPDGAPTALLGWPGLYATRRLHARDVRESPSYTPPRRDTFGAHDLTLLHDRAVLVQEHREGSFTAPPQDRVSIELASVPVSPFHIERPRTLRLTDAPDGHTPHVAALPGTDPPEVLASYATARSVELVRVTPIPSPVGWRVLSRQHGPATPPDALASDLGTAAGTCDAVLAWRTSSALLLRAIDSRSGRVGAITRLPAPAGTHAPRVTLVRSGALTLVATHGARGVSVYSAFQDPDCSLDLRPVALPNTPAFGPGARLAGFAGDDARAVLAVTHATLDDARTPLTFATIATATGLASATPPPETIPSSVRDLGIFNAPTAVVAGFSARGLRLQRVGDVSDDGEAGEDLLIRGSRAAEFVLASSPSLRRVWVADTAGPEPSDFGPAGSVVLYSAVDTLEDGPRTEIRMGAVPYAAFRRLTLDPLTLASRPNHLSAWAATWSASAEPDCLPGAFAALYGSDDQPLARIAQSPSEPFAHAVALVPTPIARCGDRVDAIAWSGDRFAAALSGQALGERLVFGSIDSGVPSHDSPAVDEASIRSLTVARLGAGIAAAWVSGPAGNERLRYRLFRMNGSSHGAPHTLGRLDRAPVRPVILSASGDALAAMAVTANGPVVLQSQCRLP